MLLCKLKSVGRKAPGKFYSFFKKIFFCLFFLEFFSAFITFSTMPEVAQKIKMFFALAPVTRIKYAKSPIVKLLNLPERFLRVSSYFIPISVHPKSH